MIGIAGRDQDVGRLHVAMDDAGRVGGVERHGDGGEHRDDPRRRERTVLGQESAEIPTGHVFHRDVEPLPRLADVADADDGGVHERAGEPRLADEAQAQRLVRLKLPRQELQRDLVSGDDVPRAIDRADADGRQHAGDLVAAEPGPDFQWRGQDLTSASRSPP